MISLKPQSNSKEGRRVRRIFGGAFLLVMLIALHGTQSVEAQIGYTLITMAVFLPAALWVRAGMPGIPIWPVVSVISWLVYALPILRDELAQEMYSPTAVLVFGATVAAYLTAATIVWTLMLPTGPQRASLGAPEHVTQRQIDAIVFFGLVTGVLYYIVLPSGLLDFLGSAFGLVRSIVFTCTVVSCYMLGCARGIGALRGPTWILALSTLIATVLLTWTSLFLVIGITDLLAATVGYVITTKRIPWMTIVATGIVLTVLQAGKATIRDRYWQYGSNQTSRLTLSGVPGFLAEWTEVGVDTLISGNSTTAVFDRASLYRQFLAVQHLAPQYVTFLNGETYALLPQLLVPRFLAPSKITSQTGMTILNLHFGFQTREGTRKTAMGWGLIAEAYANYGYIAVIGIGLLTGAIAGIFSRLSCGTGSISLASFLGIVALMNMVDLEADLSYLLTNLWQACVSVVLLFALWRLLASPTKHLPVPVRHRRALA
jgi:hypothetical protein